MSLREMGWGAAAAALLLACGSSEGNSEENAPEATGGTIVTGTGGSAVVSGSGGSQPTLECDGACAAEGATCSGGMRVECIAATDGCFTVTSSPCGGCLDSGLCRLELGQIWSNSRRNSVVGLGFAEDGSFYTLSESMGNAEALSPTDGDGSSAPIKWSPEGELIWATHWKENSPRDLRVDSDGSVYVLAFTGLGKFQPNGTEVWTQAWGSDGESASQFALSDDSIYITGWAESEIQTETHLGGDDAFISQWSKAGLRGWTRQIGSAEFDYGDSITVDDAGNVYVTGGTLVANRGSSNPEAQAYAARYSPAGEELWWTEWGSTEHDRPSSIVVDGNRLLVGGWTYGDVAGAGSHYGKVDQFVTELSLNGVVGASTQLGGEHEDLGIRLVVTAPGLVYAVTDAWSLLTSDIDPTGKSLYLFDVSNVAAPELVFGWGSAGHDQVRGVTPSRDGKQLAVFGYAGDEFPGARTDLGIGSRVDHGLYSLVNLD